VIAEYEAVIEPQLPHPPIRPHRCQLLLALDADLDAPGRPPALIIIGAVIAPGGTPHQVKEVSRQL